MWIFEELEIKTLEREILIDITEKIQDILKKSSISEGICRIFIPHTTAGITISENADPTVKIDLIKYLKQLIPKSSEFLHLEGNSDAHIKSSLTGLSLEAIIHNNKLMSGAWQGIFFAEYDGPRNRKVYIQIQG